LAIKMLYWIHEGWFLGAPAEDEDEEMAQMAQLLGQMGGGALAACHLALCRSAVVDSHLVV
jgi:hypothetical protein